MTIHSAKGLEFEVVLVPQLQRLGKYDDPPLFQWLVRKQPGGTEDELLLAPIGYKHGDKPRLYDWIAKKSLRRLRQEDKRLLYVACSRAIHELHLFATIERKQNGELARKEGSLLAAGWGGLERRIAEATRAMPASNILAMPETSPARLQVGNGVVEALAAAREPLQVIRRLPAEWFSDSESEIRQPSAAATQLVRETEDSGSGSRLARIQGIVLHTLLERVAAGTSGDHPDWARLIDALLRQHGLGRSDAASAHAVVLRGLKNALADEEGRWLLGARNVAPGEQSGETSRSEQSWNEQSWNEQSWTSASDGRVQVRRPDRVLFGGASPGVPGTDYLWIIDYKTAALPEGTPRDSFLAASREQYRSQLESYSALFRKLAAFDQRAAQREHRLAIYHPMLPWLDWWPA